MDYEQRKQVALASVGEFLGSFAAPRGLSEDAQADQIAFIADAFARRLPVTAETEYRANIDKTFMAVRDAHTGYAWPVQAEFVGAMPKPVSGKSPAGAAEELDREKVLADQFSQGHGVPEAQIWKANIFTRMSRFGVPRDVIEGYRRYSVKNCRGVHGSDAQHKMVDRYGPAVLEYFRG